MRLASEKNNFRLTVGYISSLFLVTLVSGVAHAQQAIQPYQEYDKKLRSSELVGALTSDLFGDAVNPYDQSGFFTQTDIDLPGNSTLPVTLTRRLSVRPVTAYVAPPENFGGAADWNIDVPYISGVFDSSYGWTYNHQGKKAPRCSAQFIPRADSPMRVGDIWSGYIVNLPGEGARSLVADPSPSLRPTSRQGAGWNWSTNAMDTISCLPTVAGLDGEGFILQTTSGIKYTFNVATTRFAGNMSAADATKSRTEIYLLASRIEDRHGNSVDFTYDGDGHPTRISASDGRLITLSYAGGRLQSASANGRTWNYGYTARALQSVSQPDGARWEINHLTDLEVPFQIWPANPALGCSEPPLHNKTYSLRMTHPSGAVGTFEFRYARHYRSGVPATQCVTDVEDGIPFNRLLISNYFDIFRMQRKIVEGPGLAPMTWVYGGESAPQHLWGGVGPYCTTCTQFRTMIIAQPDGSRREEDYGIGFRFNEGRLLARRTVAASGAVLESETLTYVTDAQIPSMPFPDRYGAAMGANDLSSSLIRPLQRRDLTRDGVTMRWQANSFDEYGRPVSVTQSSSQGVSRTETTRYYDDTSGWILGQVSSRTNNNTGLVENQTTYNAKALPVEQRRFGKLLQTLTYHADGNVASFADGRGSRTSLNNWKRGFPQSIGFADGTSISASVDDNGWIRSTINESGYQVNYDYDAMGRQTRKEFAVGDAVAWNATTQVFERVNTVEHGLGTGHWRLTTNTGNRNAVTWFDAMWRPALTREQDASNPTATQRYQRFVYDHAGRTIFRSYPASSSSPSTGQWLEYDALGRVTSSSSDSELGLLTTVTDYLPDMRVRTTDATGKSTNIRYLVYGSPAYDLPVAIEHQGAAFTDIGRDVFGKITSIRRRNADGSQSVTRSYVYNPQQELCKSVEPETGATAIAYDAAGNVTWSAAGIAQLSSASCDAAAAHASGRRVERTYDARNRLKQLQFADGSGNQSWQYNSAGLPIQVTTSNPAGRTVTNTYAYSKRGLITGEKLEQPGVTGWTMGYGYDGNGALASIQYPSGLLLTLAPNALGQPTRVGNYAAGISYHPNGAVRGFTYGNGVAHSMTQNGRGLPAGAVDAGILNNSFVYDRNGNVASITDAIEPVKSIKMEYDLLNRLTQATSGAFGGDSNYRYTYDALDNLRSAKLGGIKQHNYWYDASNRLTNVNRDDGSALIGLNYDVQGNLSKKNGEDFSFDLGNRLRDVGGREAYAYDAHGRRIGNYSSLDGDVLSFYGHDGVLRRQENKRAKKDVEYISLGSNLIAQVEKITGLAVPKLSGPATVQTGSYTLSWTAVGQVLRYELRVSADGGLSWSTLYTGSALSKALTGVPRGVRQYQIRSCDANACSAFSISTFVRHLPIPVPATAPVLSGPPSSTGDYQLDWSGIPDATSYRLEEQVANGSWSLMSDDATRTHSFSARAAGVYRYRVAGCSEGGCGPWSNTLEKKVILPPPSIPQNAKTRKVSLDWDWGLEVSWSPSPGAEYYEIRVSLPGWKDNMFNVGPQLSKVWNMNKEPTPIGDFSVRACNASSCSDWAPALTEKG